MKHFLLLDSHANITNVISECCLPIKMSTDRVYEKQKLIILFILLVWLSILHSITIQPQDTVLTVEPDYLYFNYPDFSIIQTFSSPNFVVNIYYTIVMIKIRCHIL